MIAHEDTIVVPPHVTQPDYEGELAVVIGQRCRDVALDDALDVIAGVTSRTTSRRAITST